MSERYANCTVHNGMHDDRRFNLLAELGGWTWGDACWRMVQLFARCTALQTDRPPADEIRIHLGLRGEQLLVDSTLGERQDDGSIRIRGGGLTGGDVDRFSWYAPVVRKSSAGGTARADQVRKTGRGPRGRFAPAGDQRDQQPHQRATSDTSDPPAFYPQAPASGIRNPEEDQRRSLPRDPAVPPAVPVAHQQHVPLDLTTSPAIPPPAPITPEAKALHEGRRALFWRCWQLAGEAFARVQASGIDAHAPNGWSGTPDATSPPAQNLLAIIAGMLVGERPDFAAAEAKIANRIAVAEAEARAMSPPSARYMTPARIWNRDSFAIAVDMSPEQAATPVIRASRAGPKSSAARANSDPKIGRIEPPPASAFRGGIQKL